MAGSGTLSLDGACFLHPLQGNFHKGVHFQTESVTARHISCFASTTSTSEADITGSCR